MRQVGRFHGKVAAITGGANGIGEATARAFAEEGARVIILDRDPAGHDVASAIAAADGEASFIACDVSSEPSVVAAFAAIRAAAGALDVLVNDAAVFVLKGLDATVDEWQLSLNVNVIGAALCAREAVPLMRGRAAAIVNLGSISGFVAQPNFAAYSVTKAAIIQLTRNLAMDLAPGIGVNCVCPGSIRTAATDRHMAATGESEAEYLAKNGPLYLLGRVGTPTEVANAVLFLASDEASFITATALMVDGGYVAK